MHGATIKIKLMAFTFETSVPTSQRISCFSSKNVKQLVLFRQNMGFPFLKLFQTLE